MVINSRDAAPKWKNVVTEEEARCRKFPLPSRAAGTLDEDPWFRGAEDALQVCNGVNGDDPCPFRTKCLLWSLMNNDAYGVWGGMTVPQRKWVRRNIPRAEWGDDEHLRKTTPPPEYFKDYGDEEDDED